MRKTILLLSSVFVLSACGSSNNVADNDETTEESVEVTTTIEVKDMESKAKELFGNDIRFEINEEVSTSDIAEPHTEYRITLTDTSIAEANDRIDSNQGTDGDLEKIRDLREKTKELAQDLDNNLDAVVTDYINEVDNIYLLAYSQKNNDIIPIVE
ncbi:hypothetical protein [Facklamia sp. P12955]|uniref:hypothetical protein n=1 Tax=Facklamia sp. P12955 TaxID=3421946 RepID=UPI003D171AF4